MFLLSLLFLCCIDCFDCFVFLKVCEMLLNVFNFFYSRNTYYISFGMLMNWDEFCGVFWNALHRKCHSYTLDWSKTGVESCIALRQQRDRMKRNDFECFGMETYLRLPGLLHLLHSLPYRQLWMLWSGPGPERMPERMPQ
jgi:hypothetical protein